MSAQARASGERAPAGRAFAVVFASLTLLYLVTLARDVTLWDAGEFLSAIRTLGIPHPPGTPLFVLIARVWTMLLSPVASTAMATNALSAVSTAGAMAVFAAVMTRWGVQARYAIAAFVCAGATSSLWLNATETEVYSIALLHSSLILYCADRLRTDGDDRWALAAAYAIGSGWALHLTALLTVPAAFVLAWPRLRTLPLRTWLTGTALAALGATPIAYMYIRALHDPVINQGNPSTLHWLVDALMRRQYEVPGPWPRRAPFYLQVGNTFEYLDWQFALGLGPEPPPTVLRTLATCVFVTLALIGSRAHRRAHGASWRAWLVLLVTGTLGVLVYTNPRAGASYAWDWLPAGTRHEARDRDYFFVIGFVALAAWSGVGAIATFEALSRRMTALSARTATVLGGCVAALPVALNMSAIWPQRAGAGHDVDCAARAMLIAAPPNAVLLAIGDNDTYPLWYEQTVNAVRRDVTVVTLPMLPAQWYRAELRRRHALLDSGSVAAWRGADHTERTIREVAASLHRPVALTPPLDSVRRTPKR